MAAIYKDFLTGDQMFDDFSFAVKEVDDFVYEVECFEEEEDLLGPFNLQPVSMDKDAYHHSMTRYIMNLTRHQRSKFDHRIVLLGTREDGTYYLRYWKHGLERAEIEEGEDFDN